MSRSSLVYIVTIAAFAAGLWLILGFGNRALQAPEDLAGDWELRPAGAAGDDDPQHKLRIEQSGRFIKLSVAGERKTITMAMTEQQPADADQSVDRQITLTNGNAKAVFTGRHQSDRWQLSIDGPVAAGEWRADLVNRTYPRRKPATQVSTGASPAGTPSVAQADRAGHAR